jgi:hypothetical protein
MVSARDRGGFLRERAGHADDGETTFLAALLKRSGYRQNKAAGVVARALSKQGQFAKSASLRVGGPARRLFRHEAFDLGSPGTPKPGESSCRRIRPHEADARVGRAPR